MSGMIDDYERRHPPSEYHLHEMAVQTGAAPRTLVPFDEPAPEIPAAPRRPARGAAAMTFADLTHADLEDAKLQLKIINGGSYIG